ncbi:ABC transporter permease [bacterium]|nr:ABC transporter permease [bacterium]
MMIGSIKPVLFYTDILLFLLIAVIVSYFIYARRHEHLVAPWKRLAKSSVAMASLAILLMYLFIAVTDSMHFKKAQPSGPLSEVQSVFDVIIKPFTHKTEKTYSAPFATTLFSKETIDQPDGTIVRTFPDLEFGGSHLQPGDSKTLDIAYRASIGANWGILASIILLLLLTWRIRCKQSCSYGSAIARLLTNKLASRWRALWLSFSVMFVLFGIVAELSLVYHVLGTDKIGVSVLYQGVKSIRTGILIGTLTTLVMLPFAIIMGIASGYARGIIDDIIQFIYTTLNSIPGVLLIASVILMLQVYLDNNADSNTSLLERADMRLLFLCMVLGLTSWTGLCRYLRAESLKLREMDYIAAARSMGVGHVTILHRHILPNVMHIVLITVVLDFSGLVLAEAVLAYVQIGVDPTTESWGNMINSARLEMARDPVVWWSLTAAFFFMLTLVLAANLFSDAVRDALDPRSQHD